MYTIKAPNSVTHSLTGGPENLKKFMASWLKKDILSQNL